MEPNPEGDGGSSGGFAVKANNYETVRVDGMRIPKRRVYLTRSYSLGIEGVTPDITLHVHMNPETIEPEMIMLQRRMTGGNIDCEAVARIINIGLEDGIPLQRYSKTLRGMIGKKPIWLPVKGRTKPVLMLSEYHAISLLIDEFLQDWPAVKEAELLIQNSEVNDELLGTGASGP